jgi:hypothetical protein
MNIAFDVCLLVAIMVIGTILAFLISWTNQIHRDLKEVRDHLGLGGGS